MCAVLYDLGTSPTQFKRANLATQKAVSQRYKDIEQWIFSHPLTPTLF